jgi:hypothetical protein
VEKRNRGSLHYALPDFLLNLVDSASFMRLCERNKFSIKPPLVFDTAGSTTKRWVPHPLRFLQRVGYATVGIEIRGIPPFAKSAKDGAPGDLLHFRPRTRNAPFHIPNDFAEGRTRGAVYAAQQEIRVTNLCHPESL